MFHPGTNASDFCINDNTNVCLSSCTKLTLFGDDICFTKITCADTDISSLQDDIN